MKIELAKLLCGALAMCALTIVPAAAQKAGPVGTAGGVVPIKNLHGPVVVRPDPGENAAGYADELARIEEALKTLEFAFKKAVANHDGKKARELQGVLVDLKVRKQRVLDAMAETGALLQAMAMMSPPSWSVEYLHILHRLKEIARKQGMDREKYKALIRRWAAPLHAE